ncbi:MAG: TIGR03032 family protein [Leptolyngbyaceae cyanobacterium SL_5_14]|nr:TIGR03032 family protein [Leptolyngbyaceae cyanobacterium SL_5_14]
MSSPPSLEITASRQFTAWLAEQRISLAFTTYQTGKLFLIGLQPSGELSVFERTFNRAMGLYASSDQLYLSSLYQLWQFENALEPGHLHEGYDRLYVPQVGYTTGDLDIHDITLSEQGQILFVNTLFSCLATISKTHSFIPLWHPPFISKLAAEDRCHLNGLAMRDDKPRYMTAVAQTDVADGWRDRRQNGGCVIDIENNEIIAAELSMPHSPRWHLNQLWLLNSGTGEFGKLDLNRGEFQPITFCPGYLRGLAFSSNFAIVGLSKPRHNKTFSGLALDETLTAKNADARAGLQVIDLNSGDAVHWLRVEGVIEEMYDVVVLPNVQRPMALGFKSDEIRRVITIGDRSQ